MGNSSLHIQAMPYVPGQARGPLRLGANTDMAGAIAVVYQAEIAGFTEMPAGIVIVDGAPFSHATLAVLGWGVPTVIVEAKQAQAFSEGLEVMLDGALGIVTTATDASGVSVWQVPSPQSVGEPVITADGIPVYLRASVRNAEGARRAVTMGATGIGLVRTEFIEPENGVRPDTAFYARTLDVLCSAAMPLAVTIRLLDLAHDKHPRWLPAIDGMGMALGLQGVRLFDISPVSKVFEAQLDAVAQLSARYDLQLLIPYLSRYEELLHWRDRVRHRLPRSLPIGAMIETPSGALDIARWLDAMDFVAVGCNDLMQCVFAADRDQPALRDFLDPYAPLLYRLFAQMAKAIDGQMNKVQLCGLLPQIHGVLPALLGLGYQAFSVEATMIPHLSQVIRRTEIDSVRRLVKRVCEANESRHVKELLELNMARF